MLVEARPGQGGGAHEDRLGPLGAVVVAADGEQPLVARLRACRRSAANADQGMRPSTVQPFVAVAGVVERPIQRDDGLVAQQGAPA